MKAAGNIELQRHLEGRKLGLPQMVKAKCFECMGGYEDGKIDCKITQCPLYLRMPYRDKEGKEE